MEKSPIPETSVLTVGEKEFAIFLEKACIAVTPDTDLMKLALLKGNQKDKIKHYWSHILGAPEAYVNALVKD